MNKHKPIIRTVLSVLLPLLLFSAALFALSRQLHALHLHEIKESFSAIPRFRIALALFISACGYLLLTGYDWLALRHLRVTLPFRKTANASFISTSISYNVGLNILASGALRFRLYSYYGLTPIQIGQIIPFCSLSFWTGYCLIGGLLLLLYPLTLPAAFAPVLHLKPLFGAALLVVFSCYLLLSLFRKSVRIRSHEFRLPVFSMVLRQVAVSSMDWVLASAVLFALLPQGAGIPFLQVLSVFLLGQTMGLVSGVPGGLGVFESAVLFLFSPVLGAYHTAGLLLAYRLIYYIIPFAAGVLLLFVHEVTVRAEMLLKAGQAVTQKASFIIPPLFSLFSFLGGIVLLFSGATPPVMERFHLLFDLIPLPVIEMSTFLNSVAGALLLILSLGLWRRLDRAYLLTLVMLVLGALFSMLKALDWEEAAVLMGMFILLLPSRRHFYRHASLFSEGLTPGWFLAVSLVAVSFLWLGLFSYKHVDYSHDLWWQFSTDGHAPRYLRAAAGALSMIVFSGVAFMLRASVPSMAPATGADLERVTGILAAGGTVDGNLALLNDKRLLFSDSGRSFLMYGVSGRSWVCLGDPVGPADEARDLAWKFRELSDMHGGWVVFYEVGPDHLPVYLDMGLRLVKLGEKARVDLSLFSMEGHSFKRLRNTVNKLDKEGLVFSVIPATQVAERLPSLRKISDAWLSEKSTREKGFSLGFFSEDYLKRFPLALVEKAGETVAFANLWEAADKSTLSVDLMRYVPGVEEGFMDYLFIKLILHGKAGGFRSFDMGMAPLSGMEERSLAPLWHKFGARLFSHGERFYNFQGVRFFKEKFHPQWEPRYLASPGGLMLPRIFIHLSTLISGGLKGSVAK